MFQMILETDESYPVPTGTVLTLSCSEGFQLSGPETLTCQGGDYYYHDGYQDPGCNPADNSGKRPANLTNEIPTTKKVR